LFLCLCVFCLVLVLRVCLCSLRRAIHVCCLFVCPCTLQSHLHDRRSLASPPSTCTLCTVRAEVKSLLHACFGDCKTVTLLLNFCNKLHCLLVWHAPSYTAARFSSGRGSNSNTSCSCCSCSCSGCSEELTPFCFALVNGGATAAGAATVSAFCCFGCKRKKEKGIKQKIKKRRKKKQNNTKQRRE